MYSFFIKTTYFRGRRFSSPPYCGNSSVDRASAFQAEGRGFEPRFPLKIESDSYRKNLSDFYLKTAIGLGKYQSGQMGQTVNLLAYAFGGSNPSLPTKRETVSFDTVSLFVINYFTIQKYSNPQYSNSSSITTFYLFI